MADDQKIELFGVIAIMIRPDGYVAATHADFERNGYGGMKLWESQRIRSGDAVKRSAVRVHCSEVVVQHLTSYTIDQIADDLIQRGKWRITYKAIGWPDDVAEALARR